MQAGFEQVEEGSRWMNGWQEKDEVDTGQLFGDSKPFKTRAFRMLKGRLDNGFYQTNCDSECLSIRYQDCKYQDRGLN